MMHMLLQYIDSIVRQSVAESNNNYPGQIQAFDELYYKAVDDVNCWAKCIFR